MSEQQNVEYKSSFMNKQQLLQRLQDIEWDNFEVKTARTDIPKNVWETVSAFSNTSGGWIVFGVSQKKEAFEIVGVDDPEKLENDMFTTLRSKTKFTFMLDTTMVIKEEMDRKHTENTQKTEGLILQLLKENAKISRTQIAMQLNITESQVIHYIRVLKKQNLIQREGAAKGGKWIIVKTD